MNNDIKSKIITEIEKHVDVFHKVSPIRYRIRCPFCGDSQSDPRDSHMYLMCNNDPTTPILYYCFKGNCGARGAVNKEFLDKLGIQINGIEKFANQNFNRVSYIKKTNIDVITGKPIINSPQIKYIEDRLGDGFTLDDYDRFKIIWDMNSLLPYITDIRLKHTLPSNNNSITFLSDDKSTILTRFFRTSEPRWRRCKLFKLDNKTCYTIKTTLDLFTKEKIIINIAEGIFDILSVYKNFNDENNSVHIATLGSDYESGIIYTIGSGFVGSNIIIKIYIDSNIDVGILKNKIKKYNWLFGKILIIKNIKSEDFGTTLDNIKRIEYQI